MYIAEFTDLSRNVVALDAHLLCVKKLQSDGCPPTSRPVTIKSAKQAVSSGTGTVATSFALYQLFQVISHEPLATTRRNALRALREQLATRGVAEGSLQGYTRSQERLDWVVPAKVNTV